MKGWVKKSTGSWYEVFSEDQQKIFHCRIAGKMKLKDKELTNPIAVGDWVEFTPENDHQAIIHTIDPRKNFIARQSPRNKHQVHIIAANVDQALVVSSIRQPDLKLGFIDRFLLTTEPQNIPTIILINKCDLWDKSDWDIFERVREVYETISYPVLASSTINGFGLENLESLLKNKITLVSGQSGAGKSSTINAIQSAVDLKTSELSNYSGKGIHTTTFAEMFQLDFGGFIIDTPGIKTLGFNNMEIMDVAHNYREFFPLSPTCKFGSMCTHRNEPNCAVKDAIQNGIISELRYQSYLSICDEIDAQNYWERKTKY